MASYNIIYFIAEGMVLHMTKYRLVRMNRKSISLSLDKDGVPVIKAPYSAPAEIIDRFYNNKKDWVEAQIEKYTAREAERRKVLDSDVKMLTLFGREYPVTHENRPYGFDWMTFNLPDESFAELKPYIISIYRRIALADIPQRVRKYAQMIGVSPSAVKINSASTRWGSCSAKASLNFSWKLILAPDDVIDYVVVHELCHIKHMNHSPEFWSEVGKIVPDWREKRESLKDVQKLLGDSALE